MAEPKIQATGSCLCGAVKYRICGELRGIVNCHCSKCRRFHGNFSAYTSIAFQDLAIVREGGLKWFKSITDETPNIYRGFCAECGASLFWHPGDRETISIAAGSLDEPTGLKTIGHIWTSQIGDYYQISDGLPAYEKGWQR